MAKTDPQAQQTTNGDATADDQDTRGLLDSLTDNTGDQPGAEQDDQQEQGDSGQGPSEPGVDVDKIVASIEERLSERFDAVADRRVNAILKEIRKQTKPADQPQQEQAPPKPAEPSVDVRAARLTFKEYLTDEVTFIGAEERKFAMDLGAALIGSRAADSDDEETLGRDVAGQVATQVKAMRRYYEGRTMDALRRRGALKPTEGQPPNGPTTVGGQSEWAKGQALAAEMFKAKP